MMRRRNWSNAKILKRTGAAGTASEKVANRSIKEAFDNVVMFEVTAVNVAVDTVEAVVALAKDETVAANALSATASPKISEEAFHL